MTILNSRPTRAESLLYTVQCVVGSLLSRDCPPSKTPQQNPPEQSPQPSSPTKQTPTPPPSTSEASPSDTTAPLVFDEDLAAELPTIPEAQMIRGVDKIAYELPSARSVQPVSAHVLGASDTSAPLQVTNEGWKIYGFAWYWWLMALGGMAALFIGIKLFITKLSFGLVE